MASVIGPGRHRGLPAVLRSGAGRSALRIVIPRKNWISYVIKFVVVENCPHGNLLLRSGTGTKKIYHAHSAPQEPSLPGEVPDES